KSPWPWRVNVKSDPDAIIQTFTASGTGTGSDETFSFTLKNNTSAYSGLKSVAILEFFSPTGEFTPCEQTIELPGGASTYTPTKHNGWAGSNIYWNGSKLTFDATPTYNPTNAIGYEGYQGVFFKWGSLIGIDPMRGNANAAWTNGTGNTNKVYVPTYNSATPTSSGWQIITAGTSSTYYTWGNIPYADASIIGNETLPARARLYEITTPANIANHRGDICRYLTETGAAPGAASGTKWRMPVANEFSGTTTDYPIKPSTNTSWPDYTGSFAGNAYGTWTVVNASSIVVGRRKTNEPAGTYQPFFPAGGRRCPSPHELGNVGTDGYSFSSSPRSSTSAYRTWLLSGNVNSDFNSDLHSRPCAFSVRCVKEL
ncbi:MAG: hypothetical protein LBR26_00300, partial [Prevotella sp.]|nr:hypothetical protein [Prevotella sp.]